MNGLIFRSIALSFLMIPACLYAEPEKASESSAVDRNISITAPLFTAVNEDDPGFLSASKNIPWTEFAFSGQMPVADTTKLKLPQTGFIKAFHTENRVYISIRWAAPQKSLNQTPWKWDYGLQIYRPSEGREDVMSIYLREPSDKNAFDLWVWRAGRTNPVSHADDMYALIRRMNTDSSPLPRMDVFFDSGRRSWTSATPDSFISDVTPRFLCTLPTGSAADVSASGEWADGMWTVTFSRTKKAVFADDLDFSKAMELFITPTRPNEREWDFNAPPSVRITLSGSPLTVKEEKK